MLGNSRHRDRSVLRNGPGVMFGRTYVLPGSPPTPTDLGTVRALLEHEGVKGAAAALGISESGVKNRLAVARCRARVPSTVALVWKLRNHLEEAGL